MYNRSLVAGSGQPQQQPHHQPPQWPGVSDISRAAHWDGQAAQGSSTHLRFSGPREAVLAGFFRSDSGSTVAAPGGPKLSHKTFSKLSERGTKGRESFLMDIMAVVPLVAVGLPISFILTSLVAIGKPSNPDELWTPTDADLREVGLEEVGGIGVALLRRTKDRRAAIRTACAGLVLEVLFLYFLLVSCLEGFRSIEKGTPLVLLWSSMFFHIISCCTSIIRGIKAWDTACPENYATIHRIMVMMEGFLIPVATGFIGCIFLAKSDGITDLVLNTTAVGWISQANLQMAGLIVWSLSAHGGRVYQPTRVCIKDSVNSMRYAFYTLGGAATIALVMVSASLNFYK